jgi:hypothetical protein
MKRELAAVPDLEKLAAWDADDKVPAAEAAKGASK